MQNAYETWDGYISQKGGMFPNSIMAAQCYILKLQCKNLPHIIQAFMLAPEHL